MKTGIDITKYNVISDFDKHSYKTFKTSGMCTSRTS